MQGTKLPAPDRWSSAGSARFRFRFASTTRCFLLLNRHGCYLLFERPSREAHIGHLQGQIADGYFHVRNVI
jgi:hypothetical protein